MLGQALRGAFNRYSTLLETRPMATRSVTAFCVVSSGDLVAQCITHRPRNYRQYSSALFLNYQFYFILFSRQKKVLIVSFAQCGGHGHVWSVLDCAHRLRVLQPTPPDRPTLFFPTQARPEEGALTQTPFLLPFGMQVVSSHRTHNITASAGPHDLAAIVFLRLLAV